MIKPKTHKLIQSFKLMNRGKNRGKLAAAMKLARAGTSKNLKPTEKTPSMRIRKAVRKKYG